MTLEDLIDEKDKTEQPGYCTRCGSEGERHKYYWRCKNDNCEVITYIPTEHEVKERLLV